MTEKETILSGLLQPLRSLTATDPRKTEIQLELPQHTIAPKHNCLSVKQLEIEFQPVYMGTVHSQLTR